MNDVLMSAQADNDKIRSLFDLISDLLTELDCSKGNNDAVMKIITHLNTLVCFGELLSAALNDNITKLWHTLQRQKQS